MPLVKRLGKKSSTKETKNRVIRTKIEVTLPEEQEDAITSISEATFLIYGENKIGKTSFASMFPEALFLMFEPGGKGLKIYRRQVSNWKEFVAYIDLLEKDRDRFETVVVDPVAMSYKAVVDFICEREGVTDPRDVGWGNGWKAIEDEFMKQINRISSTGRGVVFLGHPEIIEFEKRTGGTYNKIVPRMMKQARQFIEAFVDVTGFYGYYGDERFLSIEGSDQIDAGHRLKYKFRTPEGEKIHSIPMGESEEEAFKNFKRAFNNKQKDRCEPDYNPSMQEVKPERKKRG